MDKAGLILGDYLWSLEKYTEHQQTKAELEGALASLAPGTHNFYIVKPAEWKRALKDSDPADPNTFYAKRQKVALRVP